MNIWHCETCRSRLPNDETAEQHAVGRHVIHKESHCFRYGDEDGHSDCPCYLPPTATARRTTDE